MSEYRWLTEMSQQFLEKDYLLPGQSVDARVDIICRRAEQILKRPGFAAEFKANIQKGWYSLSTPIWANFGTERGLPISCFGSHIEDTTESILRTHAEVGMMTKHGGGTSVYIGDIRPRGSVITGNGTSDGSVHFAQMFDKLISLINQGKTRRGNISIYQDIDHKDIDEFLGIKSEGHPIQDVSFGVCVSDAWMRKMIDGDEEYRRVWAKVIQSRINTGYPYILFTDNANRGAADVYRDKGMRIRHSNLCIEIMLPTNAAESFVCDLSSMNILYYDEWKSTNAVALLAFFLDAVMTEFIEKAKYITFLDRAVRFAENHRAIGIGWLGWHSYLQSKMIPFESVQAKAINTSVAKTIKAQAYRASQDLAAAYGEPALLKGYGRRNSTLCAIAPTKSSAFILGQVSEQVEPHRSNYCIKDLAKGKYTIKNTALMPVLETHGKNDDATWESILKHSGSVQHLGFLSEHEKAVFKTFAEISPKEIIIQAAARQKYIDQGQSLNLMISPTIPARDINALLIYAWEQGIKSLYYQIGVNAAQEFARDILSCKSCES